MLLTLLALNLLAPLVGLGVLAAFLISPRRGLLRRLPEELSERSGLLHESDLSALAGRPVLWVHAASAGEVSAVEGLLEMLRARPQSPAIVMTCTTMAGRDEARRRRAADAVFLAPLDCWPAVSAFLARTRPYSLILVETEVWPNMLYQAGAAGLKIGLVNGRISDRSFPRYRLISFFLRPFLALIDRVAVQTETDRDRFLALGAAPGSVLVAGNMKFDRHTAADPSAAAGRLKTLGWTGSPLWVVGSSHPGEEDAIIAAFLEARKRFPALRLVIAPRHVERAAGTAAVLRRAELSYALWTAGPVPDVPVDVLILDLLGLLPGFYPHASFSFVGGTLVPVGGHNLLEPALAGSVVLFGPHTAHTRQAADLLASGGGGFLIADTQELAAKVCELLADPPRTAAQGRKARLLAEGLRGATQRTWEHLQPVLPPPAHRRKVV